MSVADNIRELRKKQAERERNIYTPQWKTQTVPKTDRTDKADRTAADSVFDMMATTRPAVKAETQPIIQTKPVSSMPAEEAVPQGRYEKPTSVKERRNEAMAANVSVQTQFDRDLEARRKNLESQGYIVDEFGFIEGRLLSAPPSINKATKQKPWEIVAQADKQKDSVFDMMATTRPAVKAETQPIIQTKPVSSMPAEEAVPQGRYGETTSVKERRNEVKAAKQKEQKRIDTFKGSLQTTPQQAVNSVQDRLAQVKPVQSKIPEPSASEPETHIERDQALLNAVIDAAKRVTKPVTDYLGKNLMAGVGQGNYGFYNALESIGGDQIPGVKDVLKFGKDVAKKDMAKGGQDFGSKLVQGVPDAVISLVMAYLTRGASVTVNLADTAIIQTAKKIVNSPMFWDTFIKSYGSMYGEGREKGADRGEAIAAAVLVALPTALSEMSGGIETLPDKVGSQGLFRTMWETGKEEFGEELIQYPFSAAAKKATFAPDTPIFSMEEEAVINPLQMAEGAALGGILGGAMGGVGTAFSNMATLNSIDSQAKIAKVLAEKAGQGKAYDMLQQKPVEQMTVDEKVNFIETLQSDMGIKANGSGVTFTEDQAKDFIPVEPSKTVPDQSTGTDENIPAQNKPVPVQRSYVEELDDMIREQQSIVEDIEYRKNYLGEDVEAELAENTQKLNSLVQQKQDFETQREQRIKESEQARQFEQWDISDYLRGMKTGESAQAKQTVQQPTTVSEPQQTTNANIPVPDVKTDAGQAQAKNTGIHYGDLGKADYLPIMPGRGTGHFGTGTYFFGNDNAPGAKGYSEKTQGGQARPRHEVSFEGYNLYTPKTAEEGRNLHQFLKSVNDMSFSEGFEDVIDDILAEKVTDSYVEDLIAEKFPKTGDFNTGISEDEILSELSGKDLDPISMSREIDRIYNEKTKGKVEPLEVTERRESIERYEKNLDKLINNISDVFFGLKDRFGMTDSEANNTIKALINYGNSGIKAKARVDSPSTKLMKDMGYEGVDVRGIEGLDNSEYGSVIYDVRRPQHPAPQPQQIEQPAQQEAAPTVEPTTRTTSETNPFKSELEMSGVARNKELQTKILFERTGDPVSRDSRPQGYYHLEYTLIGGKREYGTDRFDTIEQAQDAAAKDLENKDDTVNKYFKKTETTVTDENVPIQKDGVDKAGQTAPVKTESSGQTPVPGTKTDMEQVQMPVKLNYGKSGNAALKKWAPNENFMIHMEDASNPETQAFISAFEKLYNAGKEGTRQIDAERTLTDDEIDVIKPFVLDIFYQAGKTDAEQLINKENSGKIKTTQEEKPSSDIKVGDRFKEKRTGNEYTVEGINTSRVKLVNDKGVISSSPISVFEKQFEKISSLTNIKEEEATTPESKLKKQLESTNLSDKVFGDKTNANVEPSAQKEDVKNGEDEVSIDKTGASVSKTLKDVSAKTASKPGEVGEIGRDGIQQAGGNEGTGSESDGAGSESRPSNGSGSKSNAVGDRTGAGKQPSVKNQSNPKGNDYVISSQEDSVVDSGKKTRFKANVDAIRLLKKIESENRTATPEEQKVLAKYVGWGGIPEAFTTESKWNSETRNYDSVPKKDWETEYNELKSLLTEEEHHSAHETILNAHYTSIDVIKGIYEGLRHFGFEGGKVIEPAVGIGNFIGSMPIDMKSKVRVMTGIEIDSVTGRIAKLLYPNADIRVQGFEKAKLSDGYYDVAISNVPFGKVMINDRKYPNSITRAIHNYFFAKALDVVRPGGVVMFITSSKTMDSKDTSGIRAYIKSKADLIGAVRLPNTAFKENAMTEVTTDLLILKVREPGTDYSGEAFSEMVKTEMANDYYNGTYPQDLNEYFANHPENVLGELRFGKGLYSGSDVYVKGDGRDIKKSLTDALLAMPGNLITKSISTETSKPQGNRAAGRASKNTKNGSYEIINGKLAVNKDGELVEVDETFSPEQMKRISGLIEIKSTARELHNLQLENGDVKQITELRKKLNKLYDKFVDKYGYINRKENVKLLFDDPDINFLQSLEIYTKPKRANAKLGTPAITENAKKADIFSKDTVSSKKVITAVSTSKEALIVSLNEAGTIDLARMSELAGRTEQEVVTELAGYIYKNPITNSYETAEEYLSGNVKAKLKEAEARAVLEPEYAANVEALKAVQPADKQSWQISMKLGSSIISPEIYQEFTKHLFGPYSEIEVIQTQHNGEWTVREPEKLKSYNSIKKSNSNTSKWGINVKGFKALDLLDKIMNNRSIVVNRTYEDADGRKYKVNDPEATALAQERAEKIKQEFTEWLSSHNNGKTIQDIVKYYNDVFNTDVLRTYDGSHLPDTLEGMNLDPFGSGSFKIAPHQKDAIWRIVSSGGNTLLAHEVGAGKTLEMIAAIMELRRIGVIKKSMVVVPNNVYEQWGVEFNRFYPGAKILLPTADDFKATNRKTLMNRIATGTFDAVIVPESQFTMLPMSEDVVRDFYMEKIRELRTALEIMKAEKEGKASSSEKKMIQAIKNLETKMDKKLSSIRKDKDNINFEQLGVDSLFVDEAHRFKNLMYTTRLQVSGLGNPNGSDKAFDLLMKTRYLQKLNGGKGIVFATATPLLNSIAEVYNWMQYLAPEQLYSRNIHSFDAWASVFAKIESVAEVKPEGSGYRVKNGISKITNVGQLAKMFRVFTDFKTQDDLKLPRPSVKGGKYEVINIPATSWIKDYMQNLASRAEAVRTGRVKPDEDNMLKITTDGRKAALDPRLVDPGFNPSKGEATKIDAAVDHLFSKWKETKKDRLTHLVFIEFSTPKTKSNTEEDIGTDTDADTGEVDSDLDSIYQEVKRRLISKGIPEKEIAFIHDAKNADQKLALQTAFNDGHIRILIGNNEKMGVGINLQKRTKTITHIDFPWRPKDLQQEDGRGLRQGNMNSEIEMYVMVTEGSFDARLWDNLQRKSKLVDDMLTADLDAVEIEDVGVQTLSAQEVVGIASGNPLMQEQIVVSQKVGKLRALERGYLREKQENQRKLATAQGEVKTLEKEISSWDPELIKGIKDTKGELFSITINGKSFDTRKDADAYLNQLKEKATLKVLRGEEVKYAVDFAGIVDEVSFKVNSMKSVYPEFSYSNGNTTAAHTMEDLERHIRKIPSMLESTKQVLEQTRKNIEDIKKDLEKVFPHSEEIRKLALREQELMRILNPEQVLAEGAVEEEDESGTQAMYFNEDEAEDIDINDEVQNLSGSQNQISKNKETSVQAMTSLATESEMPKGNDSSRGAKTVDDIIEIIEDKAGVPIRTGKFRQKALGIFKVMPEVIRTKVRGDLPAIMHELGHYYDKKHKFSDSKAHDAELIGLGRKTSKPSYTKEQIKREGVAEFMRLYMINPAEANTRAPIFFAEFENQISAEELGFFTELRRDVLKIVNLPSAEKVINTVSMGESRKTIVKQSSLIRRFIDSWINSSAPFERAQQEAEDAGYTGGNLARAAELYRGMEGKIMNMFTDKQRDLSGNPVFKSLQEILEPISAKATKAKKASPIQTKRDFVSYAISKRAMDYKDRNLNMPLPWFVYENTIQEMEAKHPEFVDVFSDLRQWEDNSLQWLVDSGIKTQREVEVIKQMNVNHMPLQRIQEALEVVRPGSGASMGQSKDVVKRAVGSGATIIDPLESIISNAFIIYRAAEANKTLGILHDMAKKVEGIGDLVEIVPTGMKGTTFTVEEIRAQLYKMAKANKNSDLADVLSNLSDEEMETAISVFRPLMTERDREITYYNNGKKVIMQVETELYKAIKGLNNTQTNPIIKALNIPKRVLQFGVVTTVDFMMRNMVRDTSSSSIQSEVGINPFDIMRGYISAATKDKSFRALIAAGGGTEYFNMNDRTAVQKIEDDALGYGMGEKLNALGQAIKEYKESKNPRAMAKMMVAVQAISKAPFDFIRDLVEFSEMGPRVAEFEKALKKGYSEEEAASFARKVTQDFRRSGYTGKEVNKIVAFFNANIQGTTRVIETFTQHPGRTMLRGFLYITLPTLLLYGINHDDDEYKRLPDWRKSLFWNIPIGDGKFIPIPKPYGYGWVFGALPEITLDKILNDTPDAGKRILDSMEDNFNVPLQMSAMTGAMEVATNKSWNKTPIEGTYDRENKPAYLIRNTRTSTLAKTIGDMLKNEKGLSPKQIDYLVKSYFGTVGEFFWRLPDTFKTGIQAPQKIEDYPIIKKFVIDSTFSNESTNKLYDYQEELRKRKAELKETGEYKAVKHLPEKAKENALKELDNLRIKAGRTIDDISELRKEITDIEQADMNQATKDDQIKAKQQEINRLAETYNAEYEALKKKYHIR